MHRYLAVLNGDNINRDGYRFSIGALEGALYKNFVVGVPSLLAHDSHKPIGWNYPIGLYFEPKITKLIGEFQLPESSDDQSIINSAFQNVFLKRNIEACEPHIKDFSKLLGANTNNEGKCLYNGCVTYLKKDIVGKFYPELESYKDKDGLIYLDKLLIEFDYLSQGVFKDKNNDIAIFCHSYFRRNLSHQNNFHYYFLDEFIKLNGSPGIKLRIALDEDLIGYSPTFKEQFELEYWWGPKYDDNINEIPLGVTHYECDERQKLFSGISGTQFWWKSDDESMTLELEELPDNPTLGVSSEKYGCRYIHSIYDKSACDFDHFDGAIRMYDENKMLQRLDQAINKAGKDTSYTKLFRIDGKLSLSDWKSLTTNYYQDNPLLYEYFGLKEEYEELQKELDIRKNKSITETLIPYQLNQEDGLKIFVSYHRPSDIKGSYDRIIINPDNIVRINGKSDIVEFDIIEVKKALNRIGEKLIIPKEFSFLKSNDFYTNYPTVLHSSENLDEKLKATLKVYLMLFEAISGKLDKCLSLTIAWPFKDNEIRLSLYGHLLEVVDWLKENQKIPLDHEAFRSWLENQNKWLSLRYEYQQNKPDLFNLLKNDGVIYIKRKSINPDWIKDLSEDEKGLNYRIEIPKGNDDIYEALKNGEIFPAFSSIVSKVKCSKTNEDYLESNTSKFLDDDVYAIVEECSLAGAFWTDKQCF